MSKFFVWVLLFPLLIISCSTEKQMEEISEASSLDVIAYYLGDSTTFKNYPTHKLTHIIYSFLHLKGNQLAFDNTNDSLAVIALTKLKVDHPQLKILLSLGGWGGCETCSEVFSSDKGRQEFSNSVKRILEQTKSDGIDLDWEYPAIEGFPDHRYTPEDKHNFTLLIQTLRKTLGDTYEISFAAGGYTEYLQHSIEWKDVMPLVNRVNLMSYDLVNGNSIVTGHHTPLYSTPEQRESTDHGVHFLDSIGVPLNKIVIGAAFYSRIFSTVDTLNKGLYRPCSFKACVNFKDYNDSLWSTQGFKTYWDSTAMAPYSFNATKNSFASYDNERSVALKTQYAKERQLAGIMFWELTGDRTKDGLLDKIYEVKMQP